MIDLGATLSYWQSALRLNDWRIKAGYEKNLCAADGSPVYALCIPLVDNRTATILVRDPSTPPAGVSGDAWIEEAVIHELTHLHFAAFGAREPAAIAAEEQAVWAIAEALVKARGTPQEATLARAMRAAITRTSAPPRRNGRRSMQDEEKKADAGGGDAAGMLEIIASGDANAALEWLKSHAEQLLSGGMAGPASEPMPAAEVPGDDAMPNDQKPPMAAGAPAVAARMSVHEARAARAAQSIDRNAVRMAVAAARTCDGLDLSPAVEKVILASPTLEAAEASIALIRADRAAKAPGESGTANPARARSGANPPGARNSLAMIRDPKVRAAVARVPERLQDDAIARAIANQSKAGGAK